MVPWENCCDGVITGSGGGDGVCVSCVKAVTFPAHLATYLLSYLSTCLLLRFSFNSLHGNNIHAFFNLLFNNLMFFNSKHIITIKLLHTIHHLKKLFTPEYVWLENPFLLFYLLQYFGVFLSPYESPTLKTGILSFSAKKFLL